MGTKNAWRVHALCLSHSHVTVGLPQESFAGCENSPLIPDELGVHPLRRQLLGLFHPLNAVAVSLVVLILVGVVLGFSHRASGD